MAKTLNQALGLEGKKGVLWWQIHRILTMKRPPFIFLENVDRLLKSPASQRGRDFAVMLATLGNLGYEVEWRMINAADYGFPQKRRRVYIVGRLAGTQPRDPTRCCTAGRSPGRAGPAGLTLSSSASVKLEGDAADISEDFGATKGEPLPLRRLLLPPLGLEPGPQARHGPRPRSATSWSPEDGPRVVLRRRRPARAMGLPEGRQGRGRASTRQRPPYRYQEGALPFPDRTDGPARPSSPPKAAPPPPASSTSSRPRGRYRRLTPRELERLNGFPDDWTATGMPEGRRAFMMGNALVVGVVGRIAAKLMGELRDDHGVDESPADRGEAVGS